MNVVTAAEEETKEVKAPRTRGRPRKKAKMTPGTDETFKRREMDTNPEKSLKLFFSFKVRKSARGQTVSAEPELEGEEEEKESSVGQTKGGKSYVSMRKNEIIKTN